ncbi:MULTISPECIES: FadR/GntR family transcriptional regulator [unclassified Undibacterium]|uniref:FadR/GntR family transcriptional regulator n=1 Tax=unclassified Undibacterium TaxID=2630295 RepID=UPI002AC9797B|nr:MULTISPECIES: FadR/GntR family transcriptional regulator [unclassified Undibacterium]MEB0140887.1 FadR/GntR family transcriptional regulator [Undibacterium sp. CCC2.1]MEB0173856.1 FadR/GntR family transcriptional regulator [Undibacterium sp. CCC1.1]MEB0177858.1 FadR/GntR family transcriptional regulator [Undibacterium sp. CCC3.4]MEB0217079.1 FadR/GntR family transcriptional regulator [Undibacterium sp. 5I2]WPX45505.1 FadR/GntR family transcriptional regulator [Undibacterium sp. CCC3.4]
MDQTIFSLPFPSDAHGGFAAGTLGARVADKLLQKIHDDHLVPGTRLPSEQAMALHFGVSRTVIREAIALLKSGGILSTRKGSGTFLCQTETLRSAKEAELTEQSVQSLLNLIEVRRGLEAETAALAAVRRTPGQLAEIEHALRRIEEAVAAGVNGVEEDVRFHLNIAEATGNPYWVKFVKMFAEPTRLAVKVTRANEARRTDFSAQVLQEHEKIVSAIAQGNPELARAAATEHMVQAAERVKQADRDFWHGDGGELARHLALDPISE